MEGDVWEIPDVEEDRQTNPRSGVESRGDIRGVLRSWSRVKLGQAGSEQLESNLRPDKP